MQTNDLLGEHRTKVDEQFSRLAMNLDSPLSSQISKPPWRPKVAGRIAFFFGPIAGALVVVISLRRMGHKESTRKLLLLAIAFAAVESAILFFVPDAVSRLVGFGAEIAFILFFPVLMEKEFAEWAATHAGVSPANGWKAVGWGLVGVVLFLAVLFLVFIGLSLVLPGRSVTN
ncbi:MAG: hypothetical protein ACJ71Q_19815 [Terriglobales bacterium]|jgi:disulfide bond formation protein DsbB